MVGEEGGCTVVKSAIAENNPDVEFLTNILLQPCHLARDNEMPVMTASATPNQGPSSLEVVIDNRGLCIAEDSQ